MNTYFENILVLLLLIIKIVCQFCYSLSMYIGYQSWMIISIYRFIQYTAYMWSRGTEPSTCFRPPNHKVQSVHLQFSNDGGMLETYVCWILLPNKIENHYSSIENSSSEIKGCLFLCCSYVYVYVCAIATAYTIYYYKLKLDWDVQMCLSKKNDYSIFVCFRVILLFLFFTMFLYTKGMKQSIMTTDISN